MNPAFTKKIEKFAKENSIEILAKIAYDKKFVDALVNLTPIIVFAKEYESFFNQLAEKILNNTQAKA